MSNNSNSDEKCLEETESKSNDSNDLNEDNIADNFDDKIVFGEKNKLVLKISRQLNEYKEVLNVYDRFINKIGKEEIQKLLMEFDQLKIKYPDYFFLNNINEIFELIKLNISNFYKENNNKEMLDIINTPYIQILINEMNELCVKIYFKLEKTPEVNAFEEKYLQLIKLQRKFDIY